MRTEDHADDKAPRVSCPSAAHSDAMATESAVPESLRPGCGDLVSRRWPGTLGGLPAANRRESSILSGQSHSSAVVSAAGMLIPADFTTNHQRRQNLLHSSSPIPAVQASQLSRVSRPARRSESERKACKAGSLVNLSQRRELRDDRDSLPLHLVVTRPGTGPCLEDGCYVRPLIADRRVTGLQWSDLDRLKIRFEGFDQRVGVIALHR